MQPRKVIPFDICDPFLTAYYRTTHQVYLKLNELSQIFYSGGRSLFARVTVCTGSNPFAIHQFHEYGYLDMVYPDSRLIELFLFALKILETLKSFRK